MAQALLDTALNGGSSSDGAAQTLQARRKGSQQDRVGEQAATPHRCCLLTKHAHLLSVQAAHSRRSSRPSAHPTLTAPSCFAGRATKHLAATSDSTTTCRPCIPVQSCRRMVTCALGATAHPPHFTCRRRGGRARANGWAYSNGVRGASCERAPANTGRSTACPLATPPMLPICHSQRCPPFVDQQHEHEKVQVEEADGWSAREEAADCKEQRDAVQEAPRPLHRCETLLGLRRARRRRRRRRWHRLCGSQLAARRGLEQGPADCAGAGGQA